MESCRARKLEPGLIAAYLNPYWPIRSTIKSDPYSGFLVPAIWRLLSLLEAYVSSKVQQLTGIVSLYLPAFSRDERLA
jgi:hypothetical protein